MQSPFTSGRRSFSIAEGSESPKARIAFPPSPNASIVLPSSREPGSVLSLGVSKAIQLLKDRQKGLLKKDWNLIQLQPDDYDELWWRLQRDEEELLDWIKNKGRLDYYPRTLEFAVRMPGRIHEYFISFLEHELSLQLAIIAKDGDPAGTLAANIFCGRSADINLEDGGLHSPDIEYTHRETHYPGLIVEVAYSQTTKDKGKNLPKLADHYIVESSGNIQTVIGMSIDYRASKKGFLSIWQPKYDSDAQGEYLAAEEVVISQEFQTADGSPVVGKSLQIMLKDFIPKSLQSRLSIETCERAISIPYEKLAEFLDKAYAADEMRIAGNGVQDAMPQGVRIRPRSLTPPEQLSLEDKRRIKQAELKTEMVAEEEDED